MKRKNVAKVAAPLLGLSVLMNTGMALPVKADTINGDNSTQQMLVVYKNQVGKEAVLDDSKKVDEQFKNLPAVSAILTQNEIDQLAQNPNIEYMVPDVSFKISGGSDIQPISVSSTTTTSTSTTPAEQSQWDLQATKAPDAWNEGYTGKGVKVAVIDSGIATHSDLKIAGGVSTVDYTTSYTDDNGHGTIVAGLLGALKNGSGMVGVAPDVSLYAVKAMGKDGTGNLTDIIEGIDWAISNQMDIINMSLGTKTDSQLLHDAINRAYNAGIIVVCASGNDGTADGSGDTVDYPAKYDHVVSVSAVDSNMVRGSFSSTGDRVDVSAPGVKVASTFLNNQYATGSGTSEAAPHVTGLLALLKQEYGKNKTPGELVSLLESQATDIGATGKDPWYGYGFAKFQGLVLPANMTMSQFNSLLSLATTYVGYSEKYKINSFITYANKYIAQLPECPQKAALENRMSALTGSATTPTTTAPVSTNAPNNSGSNTTTNNTVVTLPAGMTQAQYNSALTYAKLYVGYAEKYRTSVYEKYAQQYLDKLPDCQDKTDLQVRLNAVTGTQTPASAPTTTTAPPTTQLAASAVTQAQLNAVESKIYWTEKYPTIKYYQTQAQTAIDSLPNCPEKDTFQKRLDALKK